MKRRKRRPKADDRWRGDPSLERVLEAFGHPTPPKIITQNPFDYDPAHYARLCSLAPGERPLPGDLCNYALDLQYESLQEDLFRYLFPICLAAWRDDLFAQMAYVGFVEQLYPALVRGRIFEKMLSADESFAVREYMRTAILEVIARERGLHFKGQAARPYKWFRAFATYGVILPDVEELWTSWWEATSLGSAVASFQYASCLMYSDAENPVFEPWTAKGGGGPPTLWDYEGHLYQDCWQPPNVAFLERTLTVGYVREKLDRAAAMLLSEPESAVCRVLLDDFDAALPRLTSRCAELPRLLARRSSAGDLFAWTE